MSSSLGAISQSSIRQKPAQEKKIGHKISYAEQKIIILVIFRSNSNMLLVMMVAWQQGKEQVGIKTTMV